MKPKIYNLLFNPENNKYVVSVNLVPVSISYTDNVNVRTFQSVSNIYKQFKRIRDRMDRLTPRDHDYAICKSVLDIVPKLEIKSFKIVECGTSNSDQTKMKEKSLDIMVKEKIKETLITRSNEQVANFIIKSSKKDYHAIIHDAWRGHRSIITEITKICKISDIVFTPMFSGIAVKTEEDWDLLRLLAPDIINRDITHKHGAKIFMVEDLKSGLDPKIIRKKYKKMLYGK